MSLRKLLLIVLAALAACQARSASAGPTASPSPTAPPLPQASPQRAGWSFDGFNMVDDQSGWAWKGLSQLYRTDDGGTTWKEIHLQGKMLTEGGYFLNRDEAWLPGVAGSDISQAVFHTTDGGKSWTELGRLPGPNVVLYFHDPKLGWATNGMGAAGNVFYQAYQTLDGGQTWTQLHPSSRGGQAPMPDTIHTMTGDSLSFTPPETIWLTSGYGISTTYAGLAVSHDAGKTWKDINPALPAEYAKGQPPVVTAAPQFMSEEDAYLPVTVGGRLVFFVSHDAGSSWTLRKPVLAAAQMTARVQFVNVQDGFAACGPNLCSTVDGGMTWQAIATPFVFDPSAGNIYVTQFDFVDRETGWAILADQNGQVAFMKTTDGGRTWINLQPRLGF